MSSYTHSRFFSYPFFLIFIAGLLYLLWLSLMALAYVYNAAAIPLRAFFKEAKYWNESWPDPYVPAEIYSAPGSNNMVTTCSPGLSGSNCYVSNSTSVSSTQVGFYAYLISVDLFLYRFVVLQYVIAQQLVFHVHIYEVHQTQTFI